jgi:hypothetical protein
MGPLGRIGLPPTNLGVRPIPEDAASETLTLQDRPAMGRTGLVAALQRRTWATKAVGRLSGG